MPEFAVGDQWYSFVLVQCLSVTVVSAPRILTVDPLLVQVQTSLYVRFRPRCND